MVNLLRICLKLTILIKDSIESRQFSGQKRMFTLRLFSYFIQMIAISIDFPKAVHKN